MYCGACEKLIADELKEIDGVSKVRVSLKDRAAYFESSDSVDKKEIGRAIKRAGYKIGIEKKTFLSHNPQDWVIFFVTAIVVGFLFWVFFHFDINPFKNMNSSNNYFLALIMGLSAGFSTCAALVGGLVVALSARFEQENPAASRWQNFQPQLFFNSGRIIGFMVLGGLMGLIGSAFTFSPLILGILMMLAGLLMLIVGFQLTGIFPKLTAFSFSAKISEVFGINKRKKEEYSNINAIVLGVLSFFLPCGFTQSVQLLAVSTGSWVAGGLIMGLFALGTTPGLLTLGGITAAVQGKTAKYFFKVIGVLVVAMALLSGVNGWNLSGLRLSGTNFIGESSELVTSIPEENILPLTFVNNDENFDQKEIRVKKGESYRLEIKVLEDGIGCMSAVMIPGLSNDSPQILKANTTVVIEFYANDVGSYDLVCAMGVPFGTKIIVEEV